MSGLMIPRSSHLDYRSHKAINSVFETGFNPLEKTISGQEEDSMERGVEAYRRLMQHQLENLIGRMDRDPYQTIACAKGRAREIGKKDTAASDDKEDDSFQNRKGNYGTSMGFDKKAGI